MAAAPDPARPVRIANCSGFYGDRLAAAKEVVEGGDIDVLTGDYLAELTMLILWRTRAKHPDGGYATTFLRQLEDVLGTCVDRGIRVVTNAGGLNPAGCADAVRALADKLGITASVAHIEGDDLLGRIPDLLAAGHDLAHLDTGQTYADAGIEAVTANAYLGGWGIAAALDAGADVVVCPRVTDAALVVGPAAWWHGWGRTDWDRLAGSVVAGHVLECGTHATGGNFSGFRTVPGMVKPGFPIAEVAADGSSVITKHSADGGMVTVDTVTAQLLYEIQGPRYLNPDATVHLETVELTQVGPDRVRIGPVTGSPPPPTAKVAVFAPIGYEISTMLFCTAPDVEGKVELLRAQLRDQLEGHVDQLDITPLGVAEENPSSQWAATVPIRIIATARHPEPLRRFAPAMGSLYLQGFPGFHHDGHAPRATEPWPRMDYWPALLPRELLDHHVVLDDGTRIEVPLSARSVPVEQPPQVEASGPAPDGPTIELGELTHARAGDKGGNSNVGVWAPDPAHWEWLRATLSTERVKQLLPEFAGQIVRHEFPHLRAVHLVLRGLLGSGGSSNLRVDQIGKSVGEYLRAKHVPGPRRVAAKPPSRNEVA